MNPPPCEECKDWGETVSEARRIPVVTCHKCGRRTYPNLGVNCPAGSAWCFSAAHNLEYLRRRPK
jgi:hypothetical protein